MVQSQIALPSPTSPQLLFRVQVRDEAIHSGKKKQTNSNNNTYIPKNKAFCISQYTRKREISGNINPCRYLRLPKRHDASTCTWTIFSQLKLTYRARPSTPPFRCPWTACHMPPITRNPSGFSSRQYFLHFINYGAILHTNPLYSGLCHISCCTAQSASGSLKANKPPPTLYETPMVPPSAQHLSILRSSMSMDGNPRQVKFTLLFPGFQQNTLKTCRISVSPYIWRTQEEIFISVLFTFFFFFPLS